MVGYDSITPRAPLIESVVPSENPFRLFLRRIRTMAADLGFTEVYNYSFVTEELARAFQMDAADHLRVANPIASDQTMLRASLLPAIRRNILENSRHLSSFRFFEIGREIHPQNRDLPEEVPHFAAAIYAREGDGSESLFQLKHLAECLMDGSETRLAQPRPFEHPERAAIVSWRGEDIGRLFELHPSLVPKGRAAILDLDLQKMGLRKHERRYQPLRRFPTSSFDFTVEAPLRQPASVIEQELVKAAGADLVEIHCLGAYTGPPLSEGRKSVSYRLTVGAADHTLSSDEVDAIYNRVREAIKPQ